MMNKPISTELNIKQVVSDILDTIDREREREIVSRRFGLFDRKETLEQIGELLGITRERVRQLEKVIVTRLKANADKLPHLAEAQDVFLEALEQKGKAGRISDLTSTVAASRSPCTSETRACTLYEEPPSPAPDCRLRFSVRRHLPWPRPVC